MAKSAATTAEFAAPKKEIPILSSFFTKMTIMKEIPILSSYHSGCGGNAISCGAVFAQTRDRSVPAKTFSGSAKTGC